VSLSAKLVGRFDDFNDVVFLLNVSESRSLPFAMSLTSWNEKSRFVFVALFALCAGVRTVAERGPCSASYRAIMSRSSFFRALETKSPKVPAENVGPPSLPPKLTKEPLPRRRSGDEPSRWYIIMSSQPKPLPRC